MNGDSNSQNDGMFQIQIEFNAIFCFVLFCFVLLCGLNMSWNELIVVALKHVENIASGNKLMLHG